MSSLCSKASMAPDLTYSTVLSLSWGARFYTTRSSLPTALPSYLALQSCGRLVLSHAKHTLISGSWSLQFCCLECSWPQVSAWDELLLLSSVCSPSREAFSNHSKKEPPRHHYPPSVFFTAITPDLFVCLLPLERTRHNSVVLTACPRHREQCGWCSARMCWVAKVIFFSLQHGTNLITALQTF